jgi:hypothetical protein
VSEPRQGRVLLLAAALAAPLAASAAQPPKPKVVVPADFLEYLATLEGAEDNWTDFEVAEATPPPVAAKQAAPKAAKATEAK